MDRGLTSYGDMGFIQLDVNTVLQAPQGVDLDILVRAGRTADETEGSP